MLRGAQLQGKPPPPVYSWRFDQVDSCAGGTSSTHGMELGWMFGTVSSLFPPSPHCSWPLEERAFSDDLIRRWSTFARTGAPKNGWPLHFGSQSSPNSTERLNYRVGN